MSSLSSERDGGFGGAKVSDQAATTWPSADVAIRAAFRRQDATSSGLISQNLLETLLRRLGRFSEEELASLFDAAKAALRSTNGGGTLRTPGGEKQQQLLPYEEFLDWLSSASSAPGFALGAELSLSAATVEDDNAASVLDSPTRHHRTKSVVTIQSVLRGIKSRGLTAKVRQSEHSALDLQDFLTDRWRGRFMICKNRKENDEHWDSRDEKWLGRASMSKRHRFLTTRDLHWQWFNALVFGLVDDGGGLAATSTGDDARSGSSGAAAAAGRNLLRSACREVEDMLLACQTYVHNAREKEGWSENVGCFVHAFGHNSVNSLHVHIVDLNWKGPSWAKHAHKNLPLEAVLEVLRQDAEETDRREQQPVRLFFAESPPAPSAGCRTSSSGAPSRQTSGDISRQLKSELVRRHPVVQDALAFRQLRETLVTHLGGVWAVRDALVREAFLRPGSPLLTVGTKPFNVFARMAFEDGKQQNRDVKRRGEPQRGSVPPGGLLHAGQEQAFGVAVSCR